MNQGDSCATRSVCNVSMSFVPFLGEISCFYLVSMDAGSRVLK